MKQTKTIKKLEQKQTLRVSVRMRLDSDVVDYFKGCEDREEVINRILRDDMEATKAVQ
jgi:uncharacterized protein (DUF4415 family)